MRIQYIAVGIGALALCLIIYIVLTGSPGPSQSPSENEQVRTDPVQHEELEFGFGGTNLQDLLVDYDPEANLHNYKEYAKYPPESRPLKASQYDLLKPYQIAHGPAPMQRIACSENETAQNCNDQAASLPIICEVTPESVMAIQQQDFVVRAQCKNEQTGESLDLTQFKVHIERWDNGQDVRRPGPIHFADDGTRGDAKAGDGVYAIVVRHSKADWGWMKLRLEAEIEGVKASTLINRWFSTPHTVAQFADPIQERIEDGNLIVTVPVQVSKAGYFEFTANLMEQNDEQRPVAVSYTDVELKAGPQTVDFLFFGKVIRDQDIDGPYVLGQLRGRRNNAPVTPADLKTAAMNGKAPTPRADVIGQPGFEYIKLGPEYQTAAYNANQFSDREWESERKRSRIESLEQAVEEHLAGSR